MPELFPLRNAHKLSSEHANNSKTPTAFHVLLVLAFMDPTKAATVPKSAALDNAKQIVITLIVNSRKWWLTEWIPAFPQTSSSLFPAGGEACK